MLMLQLSYEWQLDLKARVTSFFTRDRNRPVVIPDDAETNRETQTGATGVAARSEKGIENPWDVLAVNSDTVIVKLKTHKLRLTAAPGQLVNPMRLDAKYFFLSRGDRLGFQRVMRIAYHVDNDLTQTRDVASNRRQVGSDINLDSDTVFLELATEERN